MPAADRHGRDIGLVHRNVQPKADMAQRNPGLEQRVLEREGAADYERDQVVTPDVGDVGRGRAQHAVAIDPIARQIVAHVDVGPERRQRRRARRRYRQQRAGLGIGAAEAFEIRRPIARQDDDIALDMTGRDARGRAGQRALANLSTHGRGIRRALQKLTHPAAPENPVWRSVSHARGKRSNSHIGSVSIRISDQSLPPPRSGPAGRQSPPEHCRAGRDSWR